MVVSLKGGCRQGVAHRLELDAGDFDLLKKFGRVVGLESLLRRSKDAGDAVATALLIVDKAIRDFIRKGPLAGLLKKFIQRKIGFEEQVDQFGELGHPAFDSGFGTCSDSRQKKRALLVSLSINMEKR